jgi:hypothetical protein
MGLIEGWGPGLISSRCWLRWWGQAAGHCPNQCTMSLTNRWIIPHLFLWCSCWHHRERDRWWVLMAPLPPHVGPHQLINLHRSFAGPPILMGTLNDWVSVREKRCGISSSHGPTCSLSPPQHVFKTTF